MFMDRCDSHMSEWLLVLCG